MSSQSVKTMNPNPQRVPLRGILGFFTLWIAASTAYMAWATMTGVASRSPGITGALLGLIALLGVGIFLILARRRAARGYWLVVLSVFEVIAVAGLLTPVPTATRQVQLVTITLFALAIGYWARSNRVRRTFHLDQVAENVPHTV